ncbi:MAG: tetratricopeptide repeat protein [Planctomycetes bacterium]|nr:tetratricopeptide repeat protein [Planctomycetota bacterium]
MRTRVVLVAVAVLAVGVAAWFWFTRAEPPPAPAEPDAVWEEREAREAVRARPIDGQARLRLARALRHLKRYSEAEEELAQAGRLGVPDRDGQREAALLFATRDWPPQLEGLFQRVVRDNPDDREVLLAVADAYAARGRWQSAEPLYTRLIALDPEQSEWRFKRGVARMNAADFAPAVDDFRAVLTRAPTAYQARLFLGHSLLGDARMAEAERELSICRDQRPDAVEPLVGLATCAVEQNDLAAAEALLTTAAGRAGDSPLVLQELATLYLRQKRMDQALAALQKLVAANPEHRQGHLQLAQVLLALGRADDARRHEEIYKELDRKEEARLAARRGMR